MESHEKHYCHSAKQLGEPHESYHDTEYGFPAKSDNELFIRLMLEVNQAGLSWTTILRKRDGLLNAYDGFDIETVATYNQDDRDRLLNDADIIRNKLKVNAAIYNANAILKLQKEFGSFKNWLDLQGNLELAQWVKLFKKHFKFTGGEITKEFLMGSGYIKGAHHSDCPIYQNVLAQKPHWLSYE